MATRYVEEAQNALKPVYAQEAAAVQNQLPAIAQLYQTLVGALQQSAGTATADTVASAQRRGVNRASLPGQITTALAPNLAVGEAQLGVDRAAQEAAIAGNLTDLGVNQMSSVQDLAGALQTQDINNQQFNQNMQALDRNFDLDVRTAAARQARAAREAAGKTSISAAELARAIRLERIQKGDNATHDNPHDLAKYYVAWLDQGFSDQDFWKEFQGWWNPNDKTYERSFYDTVNYLRGGRASPTPQEAKRQVEAMKAKAFGPAKRLQARFSQPAPRVAPTYTPGLTLPALSNLR